MLSVTYSKKTNKSLRKKKEFPLIFKKLTIKKNYYKEKTTTLRKFIAN